MFYKRQATLLARGAVFLIAAGGAGSSRGAEPEPAELPLVSPVTAQTDTSQRYGLGARALKIDLRRLLAGVTLTVRGPAQLQIEIKRKDTRPLTVTFSEAANTLATLALGPLPHKSLQVEIPAGAHTLEIASQGSTSPQGTLTLTRVAAPAAAAAAATEAKKPGPPAKVPTTASTLASTRTAGSQPANTRTAASQPMNARAAPKPLGDPAKDLELIEPLDRRVTSKLKKTVYVVMPGKPLSFKMSGPKVLTIEAQRVLPTEAQRHLASKGRMPRGTLLAVTRDRNVVLGSQLSSSVVTDTYGDDEGPALAAFELFQVSIPAGVHTLQVATGAKDRYGLAVALSTAGSGPSAATAAPPLAVPAVAPPASAPALSPLQEHPASSPIQDAQLRKLQEQQLLLQEQIIKARTKDYLEAMMRSGQVPAARYKIAVANGLNQLFDLEALKVEVEGEAIVDKRDPKALESESALAKLTGEQVAVPGTLHVRVEASLRGRGFGPFAYLKELVFKATTARVFSVDAGQLYTMRVNLIDRGSGAGELKDRPAITIELESKSPRAAR